MPFTFMVSPRVLRHTATRSPFARTRLPNLHRPYSTDRPSFRGSFASQIAAGVCGGLIVIAGAYSWYHFSGLKRTVDATKSFRTYIEISARALSNKSKTSSSAALAYLRKAAKSYVAIVPGAGFFVDAAFDSVDEVFEAHQEEASAITQRAYDEVRAITRQNDDSLETAVKVTDVLKKYLVDLHELGLKAGGSVINPMWEKYPAAKEKLDGAFDELRRLAEQGGPGAKRMFDDTQQQVKSILTNNVGSDALVRAGNIVREKTRKLRREVDPSNVEPSIANEDSSS